MGPWVHLKTMSNMTLYMKKVDPSVKCHENGSTPPHTHHAISKEFHSLELETLVRRALGGARIRLASTSHMSFSGAASTMAIHCASSSAARQHMQRIGSWPSYDKRKRCAHDSWSLAQQRRTVERVK